MVRMDFELESRVMGPVISGDPGDKDQVRVLHGDGRMTQEVDQRSIKTPDDYQNAMSPLSSDAYVPR